ncbi:hypothetical protein AVEN_75992-1 [Araneus ventricosus]|uniref:DUF4773 domain-containing protein n=1 Tax=Araneus ventricosus TaxID=182803 RepID=A0A4Y2FD14_ARAVE|nr:hypothetical protein AVEN_75992-1 [Araneus ventricosus]
MIGEDLQKFSESRVMRTIAIDTTYEPYFISNGAFFNCTCAGGTYCSCCGHIKINKFKIDENGCIEVKYLPKEIGLNLTFTLNDKVVYNTSFSVGKLEPSCFKHSVKSLGDMCIQLNSGGGSIKDVLTYCVNLQPKIGKSLIKNMKIGCINFAKMLDKDG